MHKKQVKFNNVIWKEGGQYVAQCLNVDVSSFGRTKNTALTNLKEALELYLEDSPKGKLTQISAPEVRRLSLLHA
jgi:predicted RNase H-like HicB family nuclease